MRWVVLGGAMLAVPLACNGTTGDSLINFPAYASGVPGASQFTLNGYSVQLTRARMHIGAVYMNESPLGTSAETPVCINPGLYAAQVAGPVDVDLLNPAPQPWACGSSCTPMVLSCNTGVDCPKGESCGDGFCVLPFPPTPGNGTADLAQSWEIWLTDDLPSSTPPDAGGSSQSGNDSIDSTNFSRIVDLGGMATRQSDGLEVPFAAIVTINAGNRGVKTTDPAQPGLDPICKQRIVLIGGISIQLKPGGALYVTIDPRPWFTLETQLDFASLPLTTDPACASAPPYGDQAISIDPNYDYGPPACVADDPNTHVCPTGTSLTPSCQSLSAQQPCELPKRCIPNSNDAPGAVGTIAAELYKGVISGGASYSLTYGNAPQ